MAHMIKNPDCKNKSWKVEDLEAIIEREIERKFSIIPKKNKKEVINNNKKEVIEKKIAEIEKKINKLLDLYQIDGLAITEITEKIKKFHEEKRGLQERLKEPEEEKEVDLKEFKERWNLKDLTLKERRFFLEKIIKKIVINGDKCQIYWKI